MLHFVLQAEKSHDDSKASNVNIAVISVDILLDIPFALRGGTREEEVVSLFSRVVYDNFCTSHSRSSAPGTQPAALLPVLAE